MPKVHKVIDGEDRVIDVTEAQHESVYPDWELVDEGPALDWRGNPIEVDPDAPVETVTSNEISSPPSGEADSPAAGGVEPRPQGEKDELKKLGRKEK